MADSVNFTKVYAALNEAIIKLFDESGVRRSLTVPYIEGQEMADHVNAVASTVAQNGGMTNNFITSAHHSSGKGWGTGEGHTVGHPSEKLRQTVIPKDDANAKAAIDVAQKMINGFKTLLGEKDSHVQTAQGRLNLVKPTNGAGMSLWDFGMLLINMMQEPIQAIARAHSGTKPGGHAPHPRAPHAGELAQAAPEGQEQAPEAQGAGEEQAQAPTDQTAAPAAQTAPEASGQAQG